MFISSVPAFTQNPLLNEYFFGPNGLVTILGDAPDVVTALTNSLLAKPFMYNALVFVVAILIGLIVYLVLQGITYVLAGLLGGVADMQEADEKSKKIIGVEFGTRIGVRVVTLIGWFVYWVFFIKILVPFCIFSTYIAINNFLMPQNWLYGLIAFTLLIAGLHMHVIFMRFLLLRPRLYGFRNVILAEEA